MKRKWFNVDVTVLGLSLSGIAAAKYLVSQGANCTISEKRQASSEDNNKINELEKLGIKVEMGGNNEETILNSDVIITSPGIPPHSEVYKLIKKHKIRDSCCNGNKRKNYNNKTFIGNAYKQRS